MLTAELANGERVVEEVLTTRGGPRRPLSLVELQTKFRDNAERALSRPQTNRLARAVDGLDRDTDLDELTDGLAFVDHIDPNQH